jgi:hypothetical protein
MTFNYNESKIEAVEPINYNESNKLGDRNIYYKDKPKPAVMGYRADEPIPSNNETLIYWKNAFEDKVRENARLEDRIKVLRMEIDAVKSMVDGAIKYKRGLL